MAELVAASDVGAFVSATARLPFAWGRVDCFLRPADWVRQRRGFDPAEGWRGRYWTAFGAMRIIAAAGGVEALFAGAAVSVGLERTDAPVAGDVGLVRMPDLLSGEQLVGAVRTGRGWMLKTPAGVWVRDFPFVQAWRV